LSEKLKTNPSIELSMETMTRRALVIGGGIAGMQTALDIADAGYEVILVEREPSIGGHMIQLSETFPTLDCSQCIMTPKMVEVSQHPNIRLMTYCEVEDVAGKVGQFDVTIKKKAAYVDREKCTGCGLCNEKCPTKVSSEFDLGLGKRKAIYVPFPQAVPPKPVIDADNCRFLKNGKCGVCKKVCEVEAIDFEQTDSFVEDRVGAIVVATGYDLYAKEKVSEYGYGQYPDVISGLEFERLLSASGPTNGEIRRPSDGRVPKEAVFIQCVGSRDQEKGVPYCSRVCCMYTGKHAMLYKHRVPDGQAYVFYMDIRADGKGYEEFVQRGVEEDGTLYLRGRVSRVFQQDGKIVVWGADTLTRKKIEIAADMVVLATAIVPTAGARELAKKLNITTDEYGFYNEAHLKVHPAESGRPGIFLAGCSHSPKDIPDTVAHAGCAASKVTTLFSSLRAGSDATDSLTQLSATEGREG